MSEEEKRGNMDNATLLHEAEMILTELDEPEVMRMHSYNAGKVLIKVDVDWNTVTTFDMGEMRGHSHAVLNVGDQIILSEEGSPELDTYATVKDIPDRDYDDHLGFVYVCDYVKPELIGNARNRGKNKTKHQGE